MIPFMYHVMGPKMKVENEGQNNSLVYLKKDNYCGSLRQAKQELNKNTNETKIEHNCDTMYR